MDNTMSQKLENAGYFLLPSDNNWQLNWAIRLNKNLLVVFPPTIEVDGHHPEWVDNQIEKAARTIAAKADWVS